MDDLLNNPFTLLLGGLLVGLLIGLGLYRARQRRAAADVDSAFLESRLQPDSFFGASGGQRVDTHDGAATGSSMVYSPSQLDAADDVDPVAEADVYLAYGRDLQAEEILKEALRTHPGRIAIHQKLLDIYAKRRDVQAFEGMATEAFKLAGPGSQEWARICEQGQTIDPENPLYQPGGAPSDKPAHGAAAAAAAAVATAPLPGMAAASMATQKIDRTSAEPTPSAPVDLDLDLDFSLDDDTGSAIEEARPSQMEPTVALQPVDTGPASLDMDFGLTTEALDKPAPDAAEKTTPVEVSLPDIDQAEQTVAMDSRMDAAPDTEASPDSTTDSDEFRNQAAVSFGSTTPSPLPTSPGGIEGAESADGKKPNVSFDSTKPNQLTASQTPFKSPDTPDSGMLEFDLGTLSLDLDDGDKPAPEAPVEPEDPLATKLALAEEFVSIGDDDGARALIEEVIAEASGELKAKAQRALSSLG